MIALKIVIIAAAFSIAFGLLMSPHVGFNKLPKE